MITTGTPILAKSGALAAVRRFWQMPTHVQFVQRFTACSHAANVAGGSVYLRRPRAFVVNVIDTDLPVTDRMRTSASEP
jgi:hypothetical protein